MFVHVSCSTGDTQAEGESFKFSFAKGILLLKEMTLGSVSLLVIIGVRPVWRGPWIVHQWFQT
jgi:hypothetical protein